MRIDFNTLQRNNIEEPTVTAAARESGPSKNTSGVPADGIIFGHSEDNIFSRERSKKKSAAEQAEQSELLGVETQMDQMLIVAQTMSPQDAKKLSEEGYNMSELDPQDAVNSLDRMKIKLAEAGVNVAGYTDTVSADKVSEVTGRMVSSADLVSESEPYFDTGETEDSIADTLRSYDLPATEDNIASVKEALGMAAELKELSESARLFLASENMEPTIENVFLAEYKSGRAFPSGSAKYLADDSGYVGRAAGNEKSTDQDPGFEKQIESLIEKAGYEADPVIKKDALDMVEAGVPLTAESLRVYEDTKNIDLRPSKREITEALASGKTAKDAYLISDYKNIKAERITKEAALLMTSDVNLKNLDKDLSIDTGYLERDVESLKTREKEIFDLLEETLSVRKDILNAPAALLGDQDVLDHFSRLKDLKVWEQNSLLQGAETVNLEAVHEKAGSLTKDFERIASTYEAVGTEVRADLGDNIRKAFANTDFEEILKGIGEERTPENERAVRIASYSRIEVTAENIKRIGEADRSLTDMLDKLTPGRVLKLIRDNVNPLEVSVEELDERLSDYVDEEGRPAEDFARYLVLERNSGNITEEEAASYIGIYRLVNAINSGDHRALGALVASGAELNFSNLLSAVRTGQKAHVDHYIDENFGGLDTVFTREGSRIDEMIRAAFTPDSGAEDEYYEDEARMFAEAAKAEEELFRALSAADMPVSAASITAYEQLLYEGGNRFAEELYKNAAPKTRERMKKAGEKVLKNLGEGDAEKIKESYDEMVKAELIGAFEGETLDIRALQTKDRVLSIKRALADTEEYNLPAEIGEELININLKIKHGEKENSVDIYFETGEFGAVHGRFRMTTGVRGTISCAKAAGDGFMRDRLEAMTEAVSKVSGKETYLSVGDTDIPGDQAAMDGESVESAVLYRIAKAVLDTVLDTASGEA